MSTSRFLIAGTGAIVKSSRRPRRQYHELGVEIHAADISETAVGREALPEGAHFYNWTDRQQFLRLSELARKRPFDFAYLSTFPSVHILMASRLDAIVNQFIFPKPVDAHFGIMKTIHEEHLNDRAFSALVTRSCVHDHYRNKPLTSLLKSQMASLHGRNGFLKNITVCITEHKTVQDEYWRRESLECGMILDLGPHALSVIYELVPDTLSWKDIQGHRYKRTSRRFEIVSAIRARDNGSILRALNVETFCRHSFACLRGY
ncbi:MAG: hypothetical protein IPG76_00280 [Acidobacteria bacterium]|nr:hypothetical protein [Acidobacteriota bacterium]